MVLVSQNSKFCADKTIISFLTRTFQALLWDGYRLELPEDLGSSGGDRCPKWGRVGFARMLQGPIPDGPPSVLLLVFSLTKRSL